MMGGVAVVSEEAMEEPVVSEEVHDMEEEEENPGHSPRSHHKGEEVEVFCDVVVVSLVVVSLVAAAVRVVAVAVAMGQQAEQGLLEMAA